jgi:hypothetical protein
MKRMVQAEKAVNAWRKRGGRGKTRRTITYNFLPFAGA